MFKKNISKKAYTNIGLSLLLIGISLMGLSVYMFLNPVEEPDYEALKIEALDQCQTAIRSHTRLNFSSQVDEAKGEVTIFSQNLENANKKVYATSVITAQCSNMNIDTYCFGEKCNNRPLNDQGGLFMILKYERSTESNKESQNNDN